MQFGGALYGRSPYSKATYLSTSAFDISSTVWAKLVLHLRLWVVEKRYRSTSERVACSLLYRTVNRLHISAVHCCDLQFRGQLHSLEKVSASSASVLQAFHRVLYSNNPGKVLCWCEAYWVLAAKLRCNETAEPVPDPTRWEA